MSNNLIRLLEAVHTALPDESRKIIEPLLDKVIEEDAHRMKNLQIIKENLSQLRLDTRYLIFDVEATRRERDAALRKLGRR